MLQKTISIIRKFRDSKLVAPILFIISLIYIVLLFFYSFPALKALDWNGIWKTIIYCFFLVGLSLFIQFICWSLLMEKGFDNILLHASVYFRTLIFRQLPGGIWHYFGRIHLYQDQINNSERKVATTALGEWIYLLTTGFAIYIYTFNWKLSILFVIFSIYLIHVFIRSKSDKRNLKQWIVTALSYFLYLISWMIGAMVLLSLTHLFLQDPSVNFLEMLKIWSISNNISLLFYFLPSGIFLREFGLVVMLGKIMSTQSIVGVALLLRMLFIFSDVVWGLINYFIVLRIRKFAK
jgi:hypothetical protein